VLASTTVKTVETLAQRAEQQTAAQNRRAARTAAAAAAAAVAVVHLVRPIVETMGIVDQQPEPHTAAVALSVVFVAVRRTAGAADAVLATGVVHTVGQLAQRRGAATAAAAEDVVADVGTAVVDPVAPTAPIVETVKQRTRPAAGVATGVVLGTTTAEHMENVVERHIAVVVGRLAD